MKNIFIISIISLMIVGSIAGVLALDSPVPQETNFLNQIIKNFQHSLSKFGLFRVAGQDRKCSISPDWVEDLGEIGTDIGWVSMTFLIAKCSASTGLINTYDANGNFLAEFRTEDYTQFAVPNRGSFELYCCPYKACKLNSDCASSPASNYGNLCQTSTGACYSSLPSHTTKVYNCQNGNWINTQTVSYPDEGWCTTQGNNFYSKSSSGTSTGGCYASAPSGWCVVAATCSDGIKNQDETGVDCGGVCQACQINNTCSNCGKGIFNLCDKIECESLNNCEFVPQDRVDSRNCYTKCPSGTVRILDGSCSAVLGKKLALTQGAWDMATSTQIVQSYCMANEDCSDAIILTDETQNEEDYNWTTKCIRNQQIADANIRAIPKWLFLTTNDAKYSTMTATQLKQSCGSVGFFDVILTIPMIIKYFNQDQCQSLFDNFFDGTCRATIKASSAGFCWQQANTWLSGITKSTDCQTNTIILIVVVIAGFVLILKFAGGLG